MSILKVSDAFKEYHSKSDSTAVLRNFNMNVTAKKIYSLVGPSGCGKTTIISSLVGINFLDSGTIEIFGDRPTMNRSRIGYMPQENALVKEFTIREMIWFFGKVFGMSSKKINERFKFLSELLELPDGDTIIRDCSGGQQRRVSFALTLVHEPELLILDEPTVGLDPLLRVKIWDYLLEITSKQQATVLLSTHYIEEARLSTHIGLMRNGVLIAEDTPQRILASTRCQQLDEAFLKLSERQETKQETFVTNEVVETAAKPSTSMTEKTRVSRHSSFHILIALVAKNFLQLYRNIDVPIVALFIPLFMYIPYSNIIRAVHDIPLGIVNHEVALQEDCFNASVRVDEIDCLLPRMSCKVIGALSTEMIIKKHYFNVDKAFEDAKKGKIAGFIHFSQNFTENVPLLLNDEERDPEEIGQIKVHLDNTIYMTALYIENEIRKAYKKVFESEFERCGLCKDVVNVPVVFENFEEKIVDFKPTTISAITIGTHFAVTSYVLINSINYDRQEGIWNRSMAAGVKPTHFLIAHLIEGLALTFGQFIIVATYLIFFMVPLTTKAVVLIIVLMLMVGAAGLCFGLLCSTVMEHPQNSIYASQMMIYAMFFISGITWPLNAAPTYLQYIGCALPIAIPTMALRNIFGKEVNFSDSSYCHALLVLSSWVILSLSICFWKLRGNK